MGWEASGSAAFVDSIAQGTLKQPMLASVAPTRCFAVLTVDLEDWYHVCGQAMPLAAPQQSRVMQATSSVLALLQQAGVKATFFVLGAVAEQFPQLIVQIAAQGHEIASHGWSHTPVTELTPAAFKDELERTSHLLQQLTGQRPYGFRAPRWSLSRSATPWAFELLARLGYRYDSSLTPLALIGDPKGPKGPYCVETSSGRLWEVPPLVTSTWWGNLPTGGGWGFRFFPLQLISATMRTYLRNQQPAILFVHPRELDPTGPRLALGRMREFVTYGTRRSAAGRLGQLLQTLQFRTMAEQAALCHSVS